MLSAEERDRAKRFHFESDRRKCIVRSGVRRAILSRYLSVPPAQIHFNATPYGKPSLAAPHDGSRLQFNSSDSGECALYAVALRREIGVDVEAVRPMPDAVSLAKRFFSPGEQDSVHSLSGIERERRFFRIWSRKEAILKTVGVGLSGNLQRFDVSTPAEFCAEWMPLQYDAGTPVMWRDIPIEDGYAAALAVAESSGPVDCFAFPD